MVHLYLKKVAKNIFLHTFQNIFLNFIQETIRMLYFILFFLKNIKRPFLLVNLLKNPYSFLLFISFFNLCRYIFFMRRTDAAHLFEKLWHITLYTRAFYGGGVFKGRQPLRRGGRPRPRSGLGRRGDFPPPPSIILTPPCSPSRERSEFQNRCRRRIFPAVW